MSGRGLAGLCLSFLRLLLGATALSFACSSLVGGMLFGVAFHIVIKGRAGGGGQPARDLKTLIRACG